MRKIIGTHEAQTPGGVAATIYEVQEYPNAGTMINTDGQRPGIKRFELADGRTLKIVGNGEYKIEGTDEVFLVKGQR